MSDSGMTDAKGHWRKLVPAEHKPVIHRCQAPSDPQVQAISAEGSEWVCDECGRVWEARKVNFLGYGVSLYPTKNYERGGDGETDDEERN